MRAKVITVHDNTPYIQGTTTDYLILQGTATTGECVKFWIRPDQIAPYLEAFKVAGNMGHAAWHIQYGQPMPCEMCTGGKI